MKKNSSILLSTAYLPPIQYFQLIAGAQRVFIEQYETYTKQTYRNRCEIFASNGKLSLTIPVSKINGNRTKIKDIAISEHKNWQINHWRAIKSAYNSSPFFLYYKDDIKNFFEKPFEKLLDFNTGLLMQILELIGVDKEIVFTESYNKTLEDILDYRNFFSPKKAIKNINIKFYPQVFESKFGFIPGLSIIDLLFNEGPNTLSYLTY